MQWKAMTMNWALLKLANRSHPSCSRLLQEVIFFLLTPPPFFLFFPYFIDFTLVFLFCFTCILFYFIIFLNAVFAKLVSNKMTAFVLFFRIQNCGWTFTADVWNRSSSWRLQRGRRARKYQLLKPCLWLSITNIKKTCKYINTVCIKDALYVRNIW